MHLPGFLQMIYQHKNSTQKGSTDCKSIEESQRFNSSDLKYEEIILQKVTNVCRQTDYYSSVRDTCTLNCQMSHSQSTDEKQKQDYERWNLTVLQAHHAIVITSASKSGVSLVLFSISASVIYQTALAGSVIRNLAVNSKTIFLSISLFLPGSACYSPHHSVTLVYKIFLPSVTCFFLLFMPLIP